MDSKYRAGRSDWMGQGPVTGEEDSYARKFHKAALKADWDECDRLLVECPSILHKRFSFTRGSRAVPILEDAVCLDQDVMFEYLLAQGCAWAVADSYEASLESDGGVATLLAGRGELDHLHLLVQHAGEECLQLTSAHRANAMHRAIENRRVEVFGYLLQVAPELMHRPDEWGQTPADQLDAIPAADNPLVSIYRSWQAAEIARSVLSECQPAPTH